MDDRPNDTCTLIPNRSQPALTVTAPTAGHWGVGAKYATGAAKVKKRREGERLYRNLESEIRDQLNNLKS